MAAANYDVGPLDSGIRPAREPLAQHRGGGVSHRSSAGRPGRSGVARPHRRPGGSGGGAGRVHARLRHAARDGRRDRCLRRRVRPAAHRLDHRQRGIPVQPDRRDRPVRGRESIRQSSVRRSPHPGVARGVLVRGVHRGCVGLRDAGGDLLGAAHRAWLHAPLRGRAVAHREHGAGGIRCHRHTDPDARGGHRPAGARRSAPWPGVSCRSCR